MNDTQTAPNNFAGTRELARHVLPYVSGKTLDLGAGTAKYKNIITEKSTEYVAFDLFPGENIDKVGDILATGFPDNSFNTVFCTQVFEHIPTPWLAVKEIKRLLSPGGIAVVTAPFLQAYHADPHDYFRYTKEGMKSLFEKEDFEIVECGSYGRLFFVLFDFVKMSWFNPYEKPSGRSAIFMRWMIKLGHFLDGFARNRIIYGNTYVVAKKIL